MPGQILNPILLCILPMWRILMLVSSHPQHNRCQLIQRTALCNNGKLSSVPPGLPDNMEELQLNHNNIQTLQGDSVLQYPSLRTLSLACNNLERLEPNTFQDSKMLENLNLAANSLHLGYHPTSLALMKLPVLRALDLSENKLDDHMAALLLQNTTSLEYLNLSGNILSRLDESSFENLHQLRELDLQRNALFEIDTAFDANSKLQRLNLAFNFLPCLIDFHMTQLVVLNASHNSIEWFVTRPDLNDTFHLETLDLTDNRLLFFPFLPNRSHLRNLYLSHNSVSFYEHLADLPNFTTTVQFYNLDHNATNVRAQLWDENLHGDISLLEILDLRGNLVEYFPRGFIGKMPVLSRLQMCTNCLEVLNLTSERFPRSLYELDVSNNRLNTIEADEDALRVLSNLTYVNFSMNNLQHLPSRLFSSLPSIRSVDLSYNKVHICPSANSAAWTASVSPCVMWNGVASLRQLYLKGCELERIPPSGLTGMSLTHLELSDNPGVVVSTSIQSLCGTLQYLGLGNTQVQSLDFSHFHRLKSLNISQNSLTHLPISLVSLDLRWLDLRDNRLPTIPLGQAQMLASKLHTVFFTGNPFNCCQTEWYRAFQTIDTVNMVGQSDIECLDPAKQMHRIERFQSLMCGDEGGESIFWYLVLFIPVCACLVGILSICILTFRPRLLQKSIKKRCLKPTSY